MARSGAGVTALPVAVVLLAVVATVAVHAAAGDGGGKMASHGEVSPTRFIFFFSRMYPPRDNISIYTTLLSTWYARRSRRYDVIE
jgi:hypothetical protein